ncbi:hypothetical protein VTN49DRAFT_7714 [Thermomyces lanuginosus]|uniref:uncharacterized protein n=1 Tax=Thermomyces lanuginosus TaxID=5541 RepID=UPI0037440A2B
MFSRISQLSRHLSSPTSNFSQSAAPTITKSAPVLTAMSFPLPKFYENKNKKIQTAACLVIGDEVLGGKTVDTNSAYFARWCFNLGIQLKRIEVIADDEEEIIEGVRRMSDRYDLVVTSGGIGPTHDDITYQSIAKAFNLKLKLHEEAFERMKKLTRPHPMAPSFDWDTPSPALKARKRMVELPYDETVPEKDQSVFVADDSWVPIATVNGNVYVLPGVPRLFEKLLEGLTPVIKPRLAGPGAHRIIISTPLPESVIAHYLGELALRVMPHGVKVGSYPRWGKKNNTVTLVGNDKAYLESLVPEVERNVQGKRVQREDEEDEQKSSS